MSASGDILWRTLNERLEAVETDLNDVLPSHKEALEDFETRLAALEKIVGDVDAWNLQEQVVALESELLRLRREVIIGRVTALELHAMRAIHEAAHAPVLPHGLTRNPQAALNRVQSYTANIVGRLEASDDPETELIGLLDKINEALESHRYPAIKALSR